jgi:hypothetical protein
MQTDRCERCGKDVDGQTQRQFFVCYWRRVRKQAWDDATKGIGTSLLRAVIVFLMAIAALSLCSLAYFLITGQNDPGLPMKLLGAGAILVVTVIALCGACVVGMALVPPKMEMELRKVIAGHSAESKSSEDRIDYLERELKTEAGNFGRQLAATREVDPVKKLIRGFVNTSLAKFTDMDKRMASGPPVSVGEAKNAEREVIEFLRAHSPAFADRCSSGSGLDVTPPASIEPGQKRVFTIVRRMLLRLSEAREHFQ